VVVEVTLILLH